MTKPPPADTSTVAWAEPLLRLAVTVSVPVLPLAMNEKVASICPAVTLWVAGTLPAVPGAVAKLTIEPPAGAGMSSTTVIGSEVIGATLEEAGSRSATLGCSAGPTTRTSAVSFTLSSVASKVTSSACFFPSTSTSALVCPWAINTPLPIPESVATKLPVSVELIATKVLVSAGADRVTVSGVGMVAFPLSPT